MKFAIGELIDLPQLQRLMETLYRATGINHALIGNDSVVHTAVGWQDICTKFHRVHPATCARCLESDRYILAHLNDGPYAGYRCPQGLVDYATPVVIEGEHVANIFTGQMLHEPPDVEFFRTQAHEFGFDEATYLEALGKVRIIPREHIEAIMAFQVQLAQMLATNGLTRLRQIGAEAGLRDLNRGLELRTRELERANRELEEFSYSMSHDMRTPLRAIDGFSKILLEECGDGLGSECQRMLRAVCDNAQRMGRQIDDILHFQRMGKRKMECVSVDIAALAREIFRELQAAAPARRLRLEIDAALPAARGDRDMLRQALAHLLSNAVKFSPADAEALIELHGSAQADGNSYAVRDHGVGFDMRYVDKLFKVFERVHATGSYEGTGVGLALVKRIVDRHGGRVWAEGAVGAGATFNFSLPNGRT